MKSRRYAFGLAFLLLAAGLPAIGQESTPPPSPPKASAMPAPAPAPALPQAGRPVCQIETPNLDLGDIKEGGDAVGTFKIKNTGDADLKILSARPG